jgi:tetratricopeptide (TPR) repeat protein
MSKTFRAMDLPERSIDVILLALQMKTLQAPPYGPALELEYARALKDHDDPRAAIEAYLQVWPKLGPSKDTWIAGCEMAELCLDQERIGQAVSILEETLKVAKDGDIRARAKNLLVRAYLLREQFEKASRTASTGGTR